MFNKLKEEIFKIISWRLKQEIKEIKIKVNNPQISIVSFDIFDTLVLRPVLSSDDVFGFVEKEVGMDGKVDYINTRKNASKMAGACADIDEIYSKLKFLTGLSENECNTIKEKEIQIEKQLAYKRNSIYSLYQYAVQNGKKVIAVSDMYLSSAVLRDILNKCGYTEIKDIYVSGEIKARKDRSELFRYVLKAEKIASNNIIHIGDNFVSDYIMARKIGWNSCYYPSTLEIAIHEKVGRRKLFNERMVTDWAARVIFGASINSCFDNYSSVDKKILENSFVFSAIFIFPVVFAAVCKMINDNLIQKEYQCIYFVSRDGYLPLKIYQQIRKRKSIIDCKYIYASRRAYQCLIYSDAQSRLENENFGNQFTFWDFIKSIVYENDELEKIRKNFTAEELEININCNKKFCEELLNRSDLIEDTFEMQRRLATDYYKNSVYDVGKRKLVFDCGYSGSISLALKSVMDQSSIDKVYLWDTRTNKERDKKFKTRSYLVLDGVHPTWAHVLFEKCLSSFEGSCIGFYEKSNIIYPLIQKTKTNNMSDKILHEIQDNVEKMSLELTDLLGFLFHGIIVNDGNAVTANAYRILNNCSQKHMGILNDIQFGDYYQNVQNHSLGYVISGANHSLDHAKRKFLRIWGKNKI